MPPHDDPGVPRREFVKSAIAIGGTSALSACLSREGSASAEESKFPRGPNDLSSLPEGQHVWGRDLVHDAHGNALKPQHQLILLLNYKGSTPTAEERDTVEKALRTLEHAYQRGTSGDAGASINRGLIFMLGYSPAYFDRFDTDVPEGVGLTRPETVLSEVGEDPSNAADYDAVLLLTADFGSIALSAEEALFGNKDTVNGLEMEATLDGIFEKAERRTGVAGMGLPREKLDNDDIPKLAPISMGFKSGFTDNQAPEQKVTIEGTPFDGGTTLALSRLEIDLDRWYDRDHRDRVSRMFSPEHSTDDVGKTGQQLGNHSGLTEEMVDNIEEDAEAHGCLGHSQKLGTVRDDDFDPVILRRSEGVATDSMKDDKVEFNFSSIQTTMQDFIDTRKAMNPEEYDVDVEDPHHGIIDYFRATSRGSFLIPPRSLRSLPTPDGEA